jgi:alkylation response protein AidB-like acyl-CoA dehydrogenase
VDVDLTSDQELLRETTTRFIETACPLTTVRQLADGKGEIGPDYRRQAGELGWFAMLVPEALGGGTMSGNGMIDASIIALARGAQLQPGTFVGTNVVAYALASEGSSDQQDKVLPALLSGQASATWAAAGPAGDWSLDTGVRAEHRPGGYVLTGTKTLVQDADTSDWMLVTAGTDEGPAQFLLSLDTPGVTARALDGLDITRKFSDVKFDGVEVDQSSIVGQFGGAAPLVERQLQIACVLTLTESVGAMDYDFGMAVQYAKDRIAFGRPIGSFQAIKHLLADTSLLLEMSKGMALAAAKAVGTSQADSAQVVSMAKAFISDCALDLGQNCFQVFGGIGYTWEHDQHMYLRRLTADAALYGEASWHRERVCQLAGL